MVVIALAAACSSKPREQREHAPASQAREAGQQATQQIGQQAAQTAIHRDAAIAVVELDDVSGLSGLAVDDRGSLWTVPERRAALVEMPATGAPRLVGIEGVRPGLELESLAWLGPGRFAIGTEGECTGNASPILLVDVHTAGPAAAEPAQKAVAEPAQTAAAEPAQQHARVRTEIALAHEPWAATCNPRHGLEGLCFAGSWLVAVLEEAQPAGTGSASGLSGLSGPSGPSGNDRLAPVARIDLATSQVTPFWLRLSSAKGKISGVECRVDGDAIEVLAIERHFETSRILRFQVPAGAPANPAGAAPAGDSNPLGPEIRPNTINPAIVVDLGGHTDGGRRNFEGLVWRDAGAATLIVDNHWRTITGPNELVTIALPRPGAASSINQ